MPECMFRHACMYGHPNREAPYEVQGPGFHRMMFEWRPDPALKISGVPQSLRKILTTTRNDITRQGVLDMLNADGDDDGRAFKQISSLIAFVFER